MVMVRVRVRVIDRTTSSLSSLRESSRAAARSCPRWATVNIKLFPRSRSVTTASSTTVTWVRPARTRFLSVSLAVAEAPRTHTRAPSRASCPEWPHMRSCRSYLDKKEAEDGSRPDAGKGRRGGSARAWDVSGSRHVLQRSNNGVKGFFYDRYFSCIDGKKSETREIYKCIAKYRPRTA